MCLLAHWIGSAMLNRTFIQFRNSAGFPLISCQCSCLEILFPVNKLACFKCRILKNAYIHHGIAAPPLVKQEPVTPQKSDTRKNENKSLSMRIENSNFSSLYKLHILIYQYQNIITSNVFCFTFMNLNACALQFVLNFKLNFIWLIFLSRDIISKGASPQSDQVWSHGHHNTSCPFAGLKALPGACCAPIREGVEEGQGDRAVMRHIPLHPHDFLYIKAAWSCIN